MRNGREVWVVVPAHDEEALIARTLRGIPRFVDRIVVVDDGSSDATASVAARFASARVRVHRRARNGGVGAAIVDGYRMFLAEASARAACAVMAGDDQMDPTDLPALLDGLESGTGYVKGNRFASPGTLRAMPFGRLIGNLALSLLTKAVTGLWHVGDSQCGYTVIARETLAGLDLSALYPGYGFPNDVLIKLARAGASVGEVPVRAVYADEVSGLRPLVAGPRILGILWRGLRASPTARDPVPRMTEAACGS
jgi:glycosyltransferase involved in cell wall biosynthesis